MLNVTAVSNPCRRANRAASVAWRVSSKVARNASWSALARVGSVEDTKITGTFPPTTCSRGSPKSAKGGPRIAWTPASSRSAR